MCCISTGHPKTLKPLFPNHICMRLTTLNTCLSDYSDQLNRKQPACWTHHSLVLSWLGNVPRLPEKPKRADGKRKHYDVLCLQINYIYQMDLALPFISIHLTWSRNTQELTRIPMKSSFDADIKKNLKNLEEKNVQLGFSHLFSCTAQKRCDVETESGSCWKTWLEF